VGEIAGKWEENGRKMGGKWKENGRKMGENANCEKIAMCALGLPRLPLIEMIFNGLKGSAGSQGP